MINYTCEESSLCENFQLAICFHCNRRLCLIHLNEHNQIINHVNKLSNDVHLTFEEITEDSNQRRRVYDDIVLSLNQWRTKQIEKIQNTYEKHMQSVEIERERLNIAENQLFYQLEYNARQSLGYHVTNDILNHIRQTINKAREDSSQLKWTYFPLETSNLITKKKTSEKGRWIKRMVQIFSNISSIERSKNDLDSYIKRQGGQFQIPILICSYLHAWFLKSKIDEKVFLLNEHISTIQKYLIHSKTKFDVLIGIQIFFHNENIRVDKNEMMSFLLQFFLNHHCIDQKQILNWYTNGNENGYEGFDNARKLASSYIKSFPKTEPAVVTEPVVSIPIHQGFMIDIKEEPRTFN